MGIKDWFKRGPRNEGRSPGGSDMLRYRGGEFDMPTPGFIDESTVLNQEARENLYGGLFGESETVYHEVLPFVPHRCPMLFLHAQRIELSTFAITKRKEKPSWQDSA